MRFRIESIGLDIGINQPFKDAEGNSYGADWTSKVGPTEMAAIGMLAYEPQELQPTNVLVLTRVLKADIWRRVTDPEAAIIDSHLNALPVRLRRLWADSTYLDVNDEMYPPLLAQLTGALGVNRAAAILEPTE